MYVSDHPLSPYAVVLAEQSEFSIGALAANGDDEGEGMSEESGDVRKVPQDRLITLAGMITGLTPMLSKKGDRMAKFVLEDIEGSVEAIIFPQPFSKYGTSLIDDAIVKVRCRFDQSGLGSQILVNEVIALELDTSQPHSLPLEISLQAESFNQQQSNELMNLLRRYPGSDPVILSIKQNGGKKFRADLPFTVDSLSNDLRDQLSVLVG